MENSIIVKSNSKVSYGKKETIITVEKYTYEKEPKLETKMYISPSQAEKIISDLQEILR